MVGHPCIPHPFAALQVYCYTFSLDLHVLGAPPAFVLSQDQTLIKVLLEIGPEGHLFNTPYLTRFSLYSVVKELFAFITRAAHFTPRRWSCQEDQEIFFDQGSLRIRRGAYDRIGH